MLNVFRILKNNEIVAIPTDWDSTGTAKEYNFLITKPNFHLVLFR